MSVYVRIGIAAQRLGVCTKTIRRWEKVGEILCNRTVGGHRRIAVIEILRLQGKQGVLRRQTTQQTVIYARVSSHDQKKKGDLARQVKTAQEWCQCENIQIEPLVFTDVGSGLNTTRRGLRKLCQAIENGKIGQVIVTYPDRLTRFGFDYLETYFRSYGATIRCIQKTKGQSLQEDLVADLIAIVTSFSGRVHGLRSHKNKKLKKKVVKTRE